MRTVLILLAALLVAAALPAAAPAQTRQCITVQGGRVTCVESYEAAAERIERRTRDLNPHRDTAPAVQPDDTPVPYLTKSQRRLVAAVAREVQRGRCDKAETLALKAGDKALAHAAVLRCTPADLQPDG